MARKAKKKSKGMGIKTSVKSGNFLPTSKGAGMTKKGVAAYRKANPGSKLKTAVTESNPTGKRAKRRKSKCFIYMRIFLLKKEKHIMTDLVRPECATLTFQEI